VLGDVVHWKLYLLGLLGVDFYEERMSMKIYLAVELENKIKKGQLESNYFSQIS
jgi:hypothetical protein